MAGYCLLCTLTGRKVYVANGRGKDEPAEWISAGYRGGMVYAWLCGVAIARMIVVSQDEDLEGRPGMPGGRVTDWFPKGVIGL